MTYRVKGWDKFQHFKDRRPPWIKLYKELLDDPEWHDLDGDCAKVLTMIWLVASEDEDQNGALPDIRKLSFRLRLSERVTLSYLSKLSHWLINDDIAMISTRHQSDAPETETETETDIFINPENVSKGSWEEFLSIRKKKKAQNTPYAISLIHKELERQVLNGSSAQALVDQSIRKSWTDIYPLQEKKNANTSTNTAKGSKSDRARAAIIESATELGYANRPPAGEAGA